jgi:hypothetical protein
MAFDQSTRGRLQKLVSNSRAILSEELGRQLQSLFGMDQKTGAVAAVDDLTHLDNRQRQTAQSLRETLAHYLATTPGNAEMDRTKKVLDRIVREQAFTVLNRLAALRMAEARGFLLESIAKAHSSKGFQLYKQLSGTAQGETGDAYRNYLFSLFDEFNLDLAVLFDRHSVQGRLFPRESTLLELLAEINHHEIEHLWAEDETIGWIYQFWNGRDEIDQMRSASRAPRTSREMAVRNQFFTPRYVVEFLTDNTLGRIWYEMTQGNTALVDSCRYLVRRPTEVFLAPNEAPPEIGQAANEGLSQEELLKQLVYIPHRPLKDPRTIRMLDPACGSMHFGLYAFDLFEYIYLEAWQLEQQLGPDAFTREEGQQSLRNTFGSLEGFQQQIPRLIIEHNIHGVDIDPRAVQIAGLSLWQRAQRAWHQRGIKSQQRPTIVKSNIVCAEPMPGERALLQEFSSKLNPPVLGQMLEVIFEKMQLAGEAGTLLKIEKEIQTAIREAREQWLKQSVSRSLGDMFQAELEAATSQAKLGFDLRDINDETFWDDAEQRILQALSDYADQADSNADQKRLFADDTSKGFAFIDLCKKRFDVLLMNPPFGEASAASKKYIDETYPITKGDVLSNFIERAIEITGKTGLVGAITSRTCLFLSTMSGLREDVLGVDAEIELCADLGDGVLDAMVETAAYTISKSFIQTHFYRLVVESDKSKQLQRACSYHALDGVNFIANPADFRRLEGAPYCYWIDSRIVNKLALSGIDPESASIRVGLQTGDDFRHLRNFWEVPSNFDEQGWKYFSKTEKAIAWHSPINLVVNWSNDGYELKAFTDEKGKLRSRPQNLDSYFKPGFSYMLRSSRLVPYIVPKGCIPTAGRSQVFPDEGKEIDVLTICASNLGSAVARFRGEMFARPKFQASMVQQLPFTDLSEDVKASAEQTMLTEIAAAKEYYSTDETTLDYSGCAELEVKREPNTNFKTLLGEKNEIAVAECYGLLPDEYEDLQLDLQQAVCLRKGHAEATEEELLRQAACRYLSWIIGRAFGRWQETMVRNVDDDIYAELPEQPPAFQWQPTNSSIQLNGIGDLESSSSLIKHVQEIANPDLAEKCLGLVEGISGAKDWETYLSKPTQFFASHYNQYSQNRRYAPIYWSLQTPSGSYTLWIYYHRLNEQTLYTCVNNFVELKSEQVEQNLNTLLSKSARSSQEEKELEKLSDLVSELRDFRDELLRLAKLWKPNLNDGVQITAAPLWKLFQHKAWQKKLKETWEILEKGDYDWAHLACSIWPVRVLHKCRQDRSLAIAHNVENQFWEEMEVPVIRRGNDTGETKLQWQPKDLSKSELDALIKRIIEERGLQSEFQ